MTAAADHRPPGWRNRRPDVVVAPMAPDEKAYVYSTARHATAAFWGGRLVHRDTVSRLVSAILDACEVQVAKFQGEDDILGYAARRLGDHGTTVEFVQLRQSLADNGRDPDGNRYFTGTGPGGERVAAPGPYGGTPWNWRPTPMASGVVLALLRVPGPVVLRRPPPPWIMEAIAEAGCAATVVPVAV